MRLVIPRASFDKHVAVSGRAYERMCEHGYDHECYCAMAVCTFEAVILF